MAEQIDETKVPQFQLRDNGEIHFNKKGQSTLLAKFNAETGLLTFESFAIDQTYRTQVLRAITEDWVTGEQTGNVVKGYAIAGRPRDRLMKGEPPQPRKDPAYGDKTPAFVRWLFRWRPQAAYARFGVLLDSNGEPRTAHCRRIERGLLTAPTGKPVEIGADGKDALAVNVIEEENAILAMRATCMTFTTKEVVGPDGQAGTDLPDDDMEPMPEGADEPDAAAANKPAKPKRGKTAAEDEDDKADDIA